MSANTKKIDLSKCQIGQRVKLRNGTGTTIINTDWSKHFPYRTASKNTYNEEGWYYLDGEPHKLDIVEILPLPKKPAKKPLQYSAKLMSKKDVRAAIKNAEATLKLLKGLVVGQSENKSHIVRK